MSETILDKHLLEHNWGLYWKSLDIFQMASFNFIMSSIGRFILVDIT